MSKNNRRANNKSDIEQLSEPRQVRLQKSVEAEIRDIAKANGMEFADAVRIAARLGLKELKARLGVQAAA